MYRRMPRSGLFLFVPLITLVVFHLAVAGDGSASGSGSGENITWSNVTTDNITSLPVPGGAYCLFSLVPCSLSITGNLILIGFYGLLLAGAAKMIADGAELLLDLGLPAAIIGGVVLPLLGAVPDSAMIIASGSAGDRDTANKQISVGMGTLAGSTIMLLTLPWLGSLILGRVDIVNGVGRDLQCSRFTLKSFYKQGVSVFPDVTYSAIVMLVTSIPYLIVQGADWHWGPSRQVTNNTTQPSYVMYAALVTFVMAMIFFFLYLTFQVLYSVSAKRKDALRREENIKRRVVKQFYLMSLQKFQKPAAPSVQAEVTASDGETDESKRLLTATTQRKYAQVWRMHRGTGADVKPGENEAEKGEEKAQGEGEKEVEDPKWKIVLKSCFMLGVGVALVTIFSDPMVDSLTSLTTDNSNLLSADGKQHGQHIPIPVFYLSFVITPICSNASELMSSLIFASKKKKVNTSLTYSQLYGAATMNNTLCLGIFAALVYFRNLDWFYSAEVTVIVLVEFAVGLTAIISGFGYRHTYILGLGFFVGALYFLSILMVFLLETYAHWK